MPTIEIRIASSGDDTFRTTAGAGFSSVTTINAVGKNAIPDTQGSSFRFTNLHIPLDAVITEAYITFTCNNANAQNTVKSDIYGNDVDNAVAPTSAAEFDALSKTTELTVWDSIAAWSVDVEYDSPSLVDVISEIILRAGWAPGNAMQFMWLDGGSDASARRRAYSWDDDPAKAPLLHIVYSEADVMATTTLLNLDTLLLKAIGSYKKEVLTTALTTSASVVSTNLLNWRATADYFNDWWVYVDDYANAGESRKLSDDDGNATLTARGANFVSDGANLATVRLSPYSWEQRTNAIIEAIDEVYPKLRRKIDNSTLVTGNVLPNSHFEDWEETTNPDKWTMQDANITATALTTAGLIRGGSKSMNALTGAGGAGKYVYITSKTYPALLDLMGRTVTAKVWAYPETADDATLQIYTVQADGTAQTLSSTTESPAAAWTQIVLENQSLNNDLVEVQIRLVHTTASKYIYWDDCRCFGKTPAEHLLPTSIENVSEVWIQADGGTGATNADASDDLKPRVWQPILGWEIVDDGTDRHLRLPEFFTERRRIRLIGMGVFETLVDTTSSGTITLAGRRLNLLIAHAKYNLYVTVPDIPASEDIGRFDTAAAKALFDIQRLSYLGMPQTRNLKMRVI